MPRCFPGRPRSGKDPLGLAHPGGEIAGKIDHPDVRFIPEIDQAAMTLHEEVGHGSVVVTLSAGDGNQVGVLLLEKIKETEGEGQNG